MDKHIGRVMEIYIPEQYKDGNLLDVMDRTNIGFKVMTEDGIQDIVVESNEDNAKIIKKDLVEVTKQTISGKEFIDINLYEGEDYE